MKKLNLLFLLIPALCSGTSYIWSAGANGNWNVSTNWTPNGVPGFGDTATIVQYKVTVPASTTANIGTAGITAITLGNGAFGGGLTVAGTLDLRGTIALTGQFFDCVNPLTLTLSTGGLLELDENGTSNPSGMVIPSGLSPCIVTTFGSPGDVCTWSASTTCPTNVMSINNSSANGVLLRDLSGRGDNDNIVNWTGFQISNCGSASIACFQGGIDRSTDSWAWKQVSLVSDSWFGPLTSYGVGSDSVPITIDSTISSGTRLMGTDVFFGGQCTHGAYGTFNSSTPAGSNLITKACRGLRSITNSFISNEVPDGSNADPFTAGATIQNVFFDGLKSGSTYFSSANIAGGSWNNVVVYGNNNSTTTAYASILAPVANYVYAFSSGFAGETIDLTMPSNNTWGTNVSLSHVIVDDQDHASGSHCLIPGNPGTTSDAGYSISLSYYATTLDTGTGTGGCTFSGWSGGCPLSPLFSITHSNVPAGINAIASFFFCDGANIAAGGTVVGTWKANIFYDKSARTNPVGYPDAQATQPANIVSPTGTDYNDNFNAVPWPSGTAAVYNACASSVCTNIGTPYGLPMTGSAPGAHDVTTNPALLDNTRNAYSWALLHGQTADAAGFRQVFISGGPSAIGANIAALFYYIDRGNIPARSLWNAMPDGTTIGSSQPVMFPRDIRTVTR
jgi:hypothetical protein